MKLTKNTNTNIVCGTVAAAGLVVGGCATQGTQARNLSLSPEPRQVSATHRAAPDNLGFTGGESGRNSRSVAGQSAHSWDAPYGFYGQIMAAGTEPDADNQPWMGTENASQASFALEGADFDPSVTPDGRRIVFASTQHTATANLYIKGVESRTATQLTNDAADNVMPKVSPDGMRVAFASNRTGNWDLYVMPITGGRALQVTSEGTAELHPTWSPDGKFLAFCRLGETSGKWEVWVTDVQGAGLAQFLTNGLFPEWCPVAGTGEAGGDRILFQRSRERGDRSFGVWTIDYKDGQASGATEVVSSAVAACINPSWSPDGEWVTFSTVPSAAAWAASGEGRPTSANLWMVSSHGGGLVSLTSGGAVNLMPTWGPNHRLFFISDRGGSENIWHMNAGDAIVAATGRAMDDGTAIGMHGDTHENQTAGADDGEHR